VPSQQRFEGSSLEGVLADVRARFGDDALITEANRVRRGGIAGFFAKERFEVTVDADEPAPGADDEPAPFVATSLLDMADAVSDREAAGARSLSTDRAGFASVLGRIAAEAGVELDPELAAPPAAPAPAAPAPVPVAAPAPVPMAASPNPAKAIEAYAPAPIPAQPDRPIVESAALARIGLPERLRRPVALSDVTADLVRILEDLPQPDSLPKLGGSVLAVVGEAEEALALANDLAAEAGVNPEEIVLVSTTYRGKAVSESRKLASAEDTCERRRSWRRRRTPVVVAVDASIGASASWARHVLEALEPVMTWATVDATRKTDDVQAWAEDLDGIDAIAITNTDQTVSPAALLDTGIPVGRLDGRPATPLLWAALLAERLAA
jgi:hypothetical protein